MDEISLGIPFVKINHEKRTVTGIATANNIDMVDDIVDPAATAEAFAKWGGNIREMHQKKAVGRAIGYRPIQIPYNGKMYDGIEVEAYISKGAQDTWEKIVDKTLTGFSIGGKVVEAKSTFEKDKGRNVRVIKRYDLDELSIVDNPCNPAAVINLIKRAPDGSLDCTLDMKKYHVFYCQKDSKGYIDRDTCENGHPCDEIGQIDEIDLSVITKMISDKNQDDPSNFDPSNAEQDNSIVKVIDGSIGGNKLQENTNNDNVEIVSDSQDNSDLSVIRKFVSWLNGDTKTPDAATVTATTTMGAPAATTWTTPNIVINTGSANTPVIEKAAAASDTCKHDSLDKGDTCPNCGDKMTKAAAVEDEGISDEVSTEGDDTVDLEKLMESIGSLLDEKLSKVKEEVTTEVAASVDEKIDTLQKSVDEKFETVEGRVEDVETTGAVKKSADEEVVDDDVVIAKSAEPFWGNKFLPEGIVTALGYES